MTIKLSELKKRLERATPGPWLLRRAVDGSPVLSEIARCCDDDGEAYVICTLERTFRASSLDDATFLLHARSDVAALLVEVEALHAVVRHQSALLAELGSRDAEQRVSELELELALERDKVQKHEDERYLFNKTIETLQAELRRESRRREDEPHAIDAMPILEAYAGEVISGGRARELLPFWVRGATPKELIEALPSDAKGGEP